MNGIHAILCLNLEDEWNTCYTLSGFKGWIEYMLYFVWTYCLIFHNFCLLDKYQWLTKNQVDGGWPCFASHAKHQCWVLTHLATKKFITKCLKDSSLALFESIKLLRSWSTMRRRGGRRGHSVWCVVCGAWCVVRGVWCVVRGA